MAGATMTTLSAVLKNEYLPKVRKNFEDGTVLSKHLLKAADHEVVGTKAYLALETTRHHGHGARAEGGTMPDAGNVGYHFIQPPLKYTYGRIKVTGQALRLAKKDKRAFVMGLTSEINGCERGVRKDVNYQWLGDGSGVLAQITAGTNSTTFTVDDASKLEVGMPVDVQVLNTAAVTNGLLYTTANALSISTISGTTITVSTALGGTPTSSYGLYKPGTRNLVMYGLDAICSAVDPTDIRNPVTGVSSLHGLDISTYPWWKATDSGNSGTNRALTIGILRSHFDTLDIACGCVNMDEYFLVSRHGQFRAFGLLLTPDRRYAGNSTTFEGGFETLTFEGRKWFYDRDCQKNRIYTVNRSAIKIFQFAPISWADEDGNVLSRVSAEDAFEAQLYYYAELCTDARFKHGQISDLTEPS